MVGSRVTKEQPHLRRKLINQSRRMMGKAGEGGESQMRNNKHNGERRGEVWSTDGLDKKAFGLKQKVKCSVKENGGSRGTGKPRERAAEEEKI